MRWTSWITCLALVFIGALLWIVVIWLFIQVVAWTAQLIMQLLTWMLGA